MSSADWVLLARLVRPQGRKGEIIAEIHTDFPERFKERPRVFLASPKAVAPLREARVEKHWMHQGRVVLKFEGIDSINDAETLRGLEVMVPASERVPLKDDSVYIGDLIGCRLLDVAGAGMAGAEPVDVGEIIDVERSQPPAPDLLVVRPAHAGGSSHNRKPAPLLIPFAKSYLVTVDVRGKRLTMRLPAGLAQLNTAADDVVGRPGD